MRKSILAVTAALALGLSSVAMAGNNEGGLIQGSTAHAGSISGATTTETGFAGTYGISNMTATSSGTLRSGSNLGLVKGTSFVSGHSESGTLVEGAGMAGSIAGGEAAAGFAGYASFDGNHRGGEAGAIGGAAGSSWAATGSIGDGEGVSVQGFEAYGDAKAKSKIENEGNGEYSTKSVANTASGALSYTIEDGNAIGQTHAVGGALAGADTWRVQHDGDGEGGEGGGEGGSCVANGGIGNCGIFGNGTGNEGGGNGPPS
jgi:hypothetical protein